MSHASTPTNKAHARQLSRALGILDAIDAEGNEAVVIQDVREACEEYGRSIPYDVEPHEFVSLDAPEWRSLAIFCDELATRGLIDETARARQVADIAQARLEEEHA